MTDTGEVEVATGVGQGGTLQAALAAARQAPANEAAWDHVDELADAQQCPDEVAACYREVIEAGLPAELRTRFAERAVRFYKAWYLDTPQMMTDLLAAIIERDPSADWAFEQLTMMLTSAERWDALLALYDRTLAQTAERARRKQLLDDAAHVAKDFADQPGRAADYMRQLLELDPGSEKLITSLERLLEREGRYAELVELWRGQLAELDGAEARRARLKIAACSLDRLGEPATALVELEALVADHPNDTDACAYLERILVHDATVGGQGGGAPSDEGARKKALSLLRKAYELTERPDEVVRVLQTALPWAEGEERIGLQREAGRRLSILGRDVEAIGHYTDLLTASPGDTDARERLRQLTQRSERHDLMAAALVAAADAAADMPARQVALLLDAAGLYRDVLGSAPGDGSSRRAAIELYGRVLALPGTAPQNARLAAHSLNELLASEGRAAERLDVLETLASLEQSMAIGRIIRGQAAQLATELGEIDRALAIWETVLTNNPDDRDALAAMIELLEQHGRHEELCTALRRRAASSSLPQQRRADLIRIADVQGNELGQLDLAIDSWLAVRREFGEDSEIIAAVTRLMSATERWAELAEILGGAAQRERDEAAAILIRLGEIHVHLGHPETAAVLYARALGAVPEAEAARRGLLSLLHDPAAATTAVRALSWAMRQTDDWQELCALRDARVQTATDDAERVQVLRETARIHLAQAGEPDAALDCLLLALPFQPDNLALEHDLCRLADTTGRQGDAALCLRQAAARCDAAARAAELYRHAGDLAARRGDGGEALAAFAAADEAVPDQPDTLRALARAAGDAQMFGQACDALVRLMRSNGRFEGELLEGIENAASANDAFPALASALAGALREPPGGAREPLPAPVAAALERRIASYYRERCDDPEAANDALRRALAHQPDDLVAREQLASYQRATPGAALIATLEELDAADPAGVALLREAAEIALEHTDDADLQGRVLRRLHDKAARLWKAGDERLADGAMWALERLVEHQQAQQDSRAVIDLLLAAADLPLSPDAAAATARRAATLLDEAGDSLAAIDAYRRVLRATPDDLPVIRRLATLLETESARSGSLALRRRELELVTDPEERLGLRLEAARRAAVLETTAGRLEALEDNLRQAPGHPASLDALSEVLSERGRHADLVAALEEQASLLCSSSPTRAAEIYTRAAALSEERLHDATRAIAAHAAVAALTESSDALDALARLHLAQDQPAEAAGYLERRLATADPGHRVPIQLRLARARLAADQPDAAVAVLHQAFLDRPRNAEVRRLLLQLLRERAAHEELAQTLTVAAEHAADGEVVLGYAREAAQLYFDVLRRPQDAVGLLRRALAFAPDDKELKQRLAEGLRSAGELDEAQTLLSELVEAFGRRASEERAAVHLQLARVLHRKGDMDQAIENLEMASRMDDNNVTVLRTLAELSREGGQLDRAERAYRSLLLKLRRSTSSSFTPVPSDAEAPVSAAEVMLELGRIAADRGQADKAEELTASALDALAQDDGDAPRLQARLRTVGAHATLLRVLDARLGYIKSPLARAEIQAERGDALEALGRLDEALGARLRAVQNDPASPPLHEAAARLAAAVGQSERYVAEVESLLDKHRRDADVHVRCELLLRLGEALELAGHHERAGELYASAEQTGVRRVDVLRAEARLAGARGDEAEQVRLLGELARLGGAAEETRADALYRMAEVQLATEEKVDAGLASLLEALGVEPSTERAATILRRGADVHPGHRGLLDLYEQVARRSGDDLLMMHYLERRAHHADATPAEAREAVDRAEARGDDQLTDVLLQRAVDIGKRSEAGLASVDWALLSLARMRKAQGDVAGAVQWLEQASTVVDAEPLLALGAELAELASAEGGDITLAARLYERLLELEPQARQAWLPLTAIYRQLGEIDKLERVVGETLDALQDSGERSELRVELARGLLDAEGRAAQAVAVLQDVLAEEPTHEQAQALLAEHWERTGNAEELARLLTQQFELAQRGGDPPAVKSAAMRLLRHVSRDDAGAAAPIYHAALAICPDDADLLRGLLACTSSPGGGSPSEGSPEGGDDELRERAELTERLLRIDPGPMPGPAAMELCGLYASLDDDAGALRALQLGYALAPDNAAIRARLEDRYRDAGDFAGLALMLEDAIAGATEPAHRAALLRDAALVQRDHLGDATSAAERLREACALRPDDGTLALELAATLGAAGEPDEAVQVVTSALDQPAASAPEPRLPLLLTRARLRQQAGDGGGALDDLQEAFQLDPAQAAPELERVLWAQHRDAADPETERAVTLRLVEVLSAQARTEDALALLGGWVERAPEDRAALHQLYQLQSATGQWEAVAQTCLRLVQAEEGEALADAAEGLLGAWQALGKPEMARGGLELARQKAPDDARVRGALRAIYEHLGAHRELAHLFIEEARHVDDEEQRIAYLRWAGQTLVAHGDIEAAMAALHGVLEVLPTDANAAIALADAATMQGDFGRAHEVLDEAIARCKGRKSQNDLCMFWQRKSYVAHASGDAEGQLANLLKAHQVSNKNPDVAADLADLAEALQQWDVANKALRAITNIESGCRITPTHAMLRQGRIALMTGDQKLARMWARRAKRADETSEEVDAFLSEVGE